MLLYLPPFYNSHKLLRQWIKMILPRSLVACYLNILARWTLSACHKSATSKPLNNIIMLGFPSKHSVHFLLYNLQLLLLIVPRKQLSWDPLWSKCGFKASNSSLSSPTALWEELIFLNHPLHYTCHALSNHRPWRPANFEVCQKLWDQARVSNLTGDTDTIENPYKA